MRGESLIETGVDDHCSCTIYTRESASVGPPGTARTAPKLTQQPSLLDQLAQDDDEKFGRRIAQDAESDEVRKRCALVSQNSYFFNTSIRENLRLAHPSASEEEKWNPPRAAQLHEFIASLPKGYETSIGERQRLAIARTLLKDAAILIFDEPTANLEPLTERQVLETLFAILRGKTSLLITHRLVGLENVDEVLVMDRGQITEHGTQAELLAHGGLYRRLRGLQNRILIQNECVTSVVGFAKKTSFL